MRNFLIPALAALALLAGCNSAPEPGQAPGANGNGAAPAAAPIPTAITGTVTLRDPVQLNAGSKLDIKLADLAQPDVVVAQKSFDVSGAPPFDFKLDFDPARIDASRSYVVLALLTDGDRHYIPALNHPVLTHGNGADVQIVLNSEPTAADKMKEQFNTIRNHIGGLRKVQGTSLTDDVSMGWDAFIQEGKVRFMRVITERGDNRSTIEYAFENDKPMALLRKDGGVSRVGWDDKGNLVLNEKSNGGQVSEDDAKALYASALDALKMAQDKVAAQKKK